jgi:hypothetical protein
MESILNLGDLVSHIEVYVARRADVLIVDVKGEKAAPLHPKSGRAPKEAAIFSELSRSKVAEIVSMSDRSATQCDPGTARPRTAGSSH